MFYKVCALVCALVLTSAIPTTGQPHQPLLVSKAKHSGICKTWIDQHAKQGDWVTFRGCDPFQLNGKRSLFFAQLHLTCKKKPRWVKIRLARLTPTGWDSTGTNSWTLGPSAPRKWQGSIWWESKTKWPIVAQYKYGGGSCVSTQRQLKWWQP